MGGTGIEGTRFEIQRTFEQPDDAIACFADLTNIVLTESGEVVIQVYETIPGPPKPGGPPAMRSRLRATIFLNKAHAGKVANSLLAASQTAVPKREGGS